MLLIIAWCVATASTTVAQPVQDATDLQELARLEAAWNDAHVRGDADALDRLWAPELVVTVPKMPVMGKADTLGIWRTGRMRFERYETSDLSTHLYGAAAVVTGRVRRTRRANGQVMEDDWRFTKVYVKRDGRWRVVAWHASDSAPQ